VPAPRNIRSRGLTGRLPASSEPFEEIADGNADDAGNLEEAPRRDPVDAALVLCGLFEICPRRSAFPSAISSKGSTTRASRPVSPRERMSLELARNFAQISNEKHQEALSQLARALATEHDAAAV